ncbi:MAG: chemotaxis protein CheW [Roseiflexaceae bacterium]
MNIHDLRHDPVAWRILQERARALAAQETTAATAEGEEILFFQLGDGRYGLPAPSIREVQPLGAWTALPATPPFVVGLVNIRGRLLAALDIRPLLDLPPAPPQATAQLIILAANGGDVGLLADTVLAVGRGDGHLMPVPSATTGRGVAWVRGVDRHMHVLLDPAALLADPRLIVNVASH